MNLAKQQWAQTRRARIAGARIERVSFKAILARDGYRCHLCSKDVAENELSFDHVIPLAAGGEHSAANIKVAHRLCNIRKSGPHHGVPAKPATVPLCRGCGVVLGAWVQEWCRLCAKERKRTHHNVRYREAHRADLATKQRAREIANPGIHSKSRPVALMTSEQHARRLEQWAAYRARRRAA